MTKAELYKLEREIINYLSPKVDALTEQANSKGITSHSYFVRHGEVIGALQIYNSLSDFFIQKFDELEKEGEE